MRCQLKILIVLLVPFQLFAQAASGPDLPNVSEKANTVSAAPGMLYAHFDKNIYSINEMAWFTAYLTSDEQQKQITDFVQLLLVDDQRKIVLLQKIHMEKGIASGNILLPDSLQSGKYKFILYASTLLDGQPQHVFTQPVIIKGAAPTASSGLDGRSKPAEGTIVHPRETDQQTANLKQTPLISLKKAVAEDTLEVTVANHRQEQFQVVVHNLQQVFLDIPFVLNHQLRKLKIALTDLPRGVAELVLLDSGNRPRAKRLFFSHYKQQNKLAIATNDSIYGKRQKVQLTLKLTDWRGTALPGTVSVSCVQSNRLSGVLSNDIERYNYWDYPLGTHSTKNVRPDQEMSDLEKLLQNSEWKSDSWIKSRTDDQPDRSSEATGLKISGKVTRFGRRLKKPVTLILMKDSSLSMIESDSSGCFLLTTDDLLQAARKELHLMVSGKFPQEYEISIEDPCENISKTLAVKFGGQEKWDTLVPEDIDPGIAAPARMNQLKEVKIVSKRDMTFYGTRKTENACGDYVCKYGYLNCPSHVSDPGNKAPLKGSGYKLYMGLNTNGDETFSTLIYSGCAVKVYKNSKTFSGILKPQAFIPQNFDSESSGIPELSSTLLWVSNFEISSPGTARLTFYTDDLKGRFKIVVQGLAGDNVVTAEKIITVQ